MKISGTKPSIFWIWLIFSFACHQTPSESIEFSISLGVLNKMNFNSLGVQTGQHFPDISLVTLAGEKFKITHHKPLRPKLLISGSYTCDITRNKMEYIDWFYEEYKDQADIYLVNTLEAHPQNSHSPYSMQEEPWLASDNIKAGIAAAQPTTMEERIGLAKKWINEAEIKTPVVLDGPKNEFWNLIGQAPNMAVLISPDGRVVLKQSWFEKQEMREAMNTELRYLDTE